MIPPACVRYTWLAHFTHTLPNFQKVSHTYLPSKSKFQASIYLTPRPPLDFGMQIKSQAFRALLSFGQSEPYKNL